MQKTHLAWITAVALTLAVTAASAATNYRDVPPGHWAESSIQWASDEGLMTGPGDRLGFFDPSGLANRAQLATVLKRFYDRYVYKVQVLENRIALLENTVDHLQDQVNALDTTGGPADDFRATLSGQAEIPPVVTIGQGQGYFRLENDDLWYTIAVQGLSGPITAAHFHRGRSTDTGPVVAMIDFRGTQATGVWTDLTAAEMDDLLMGRVYVNVHTERHPDGEIRGQLMLRSSSSYTSSSSSS